MSLPLHEIADAKHRVRDPFTHEEHYWFHFRGMLSQVRLMG
jgi:hypothetical protein